MKKGCVVAMGGFILGCSPWRTGIGLLVGRTTLKTSGTANGLKQIEPGNILFSNLQDTLGSGVE